jgi:hypothetical protein
MQSRNQISITTLSVPDQVNGFLGYFAKGHHDTTDFLRAIASQIDENDFKSDTGHESFLALPEYGGQVKQGYYRIVADKESGTNLLHKSVKGKGAFPVTVLYF